MKCSIIGEEDGWISPAGDFYYCPPYGHIELADKFAIMKIIPTSENNELELESRGWMKLTKGTFMFRGYLPKRHPMEHFSCKPTQAQLDLVWDYWESRGSCRKQFNGITVDSINSFYKLLNNFALMVEAFQ